MAEPLLRIADLRVRYGRTVAIEHLSLEIFPGEVIAILGANGAGKTTLLNTISGFVRPAAGTIAFAGSRIDGSAPHEVVRRGIVQVSQGRDLFTEMTVLDNLELGAETRSDDVAEDLARVMRIFPRLDERRRQRVQTLSGGEQQMVAIARALMSRPQLLMFDEPSGGLSPQFVAEIGRIMATLKSAGTTMLIVEQNMALALGSADRFYVLRGGAVVRSGAAAEIDPASTELASFYL